MASTQERALSNNTKKTFYRKFYYVAISLAIMMLLAMIFLVLPNNSKLTPQFALLLSKELILFLYGLLGWILVVIFGTLNE